MSNFKCNNRVIMLTCALVISLLSLPSYASESIAGANIVKLHVYKNYRTVVQLDKGADVSVDGCTHANKKLVALTIQDRFNDTAANPERSPVVEEIYSVLLAARVAELPIDVLTSGCTDFGGATIPVIIRIIL